MYIIYIKTKYREVTILKKNQQVSLKILMIGYGTITSALISHIIKLNNVEIVVWTRKRKKDLTDCCLVENVEEALGKNDIDIILSCVPDDTASYEAWNNQYIGKYIKSNHPICVEMSTLSFKYVCTWHEYIEELSGKPVEMPFTGSRKGAKNGNMIVFIFTKYYEDITYFLKIISCKQYLFKSKGEATKFKLLYNFWGASMLRELSLLYPILKNEFTDFKMVKEIIMNDGWMSLLCKSVIRKAENERVIDFKLKYMHKDVQEFQEIAEKYSFINYDEISKFYLKLVKDLDGEEDFSKAIFWIGGR